MQAVIASTEKRNSLISCGEALGARWRGIDNRKAKKKRNTTSAILLDALAVFAARAGVEMTDGPAGSAEADGDALFLERAVRLSGTFESLQDFFCKLGNSSLHFTPKDFSYRCLDQHGTQVQLDLTVTFAKMCHDQATTEGWQ